MMRIQVFVLIVELNGDELSAHDNMFRNEILKKYRASYPHFSIDNEGIGVYPGQHRAKSRERGANIHIASLLRVPSILGNMT